MAGERTEAATPRRLQQLRDQGRVVKSTDLTTALGLLAGFVVLGQLGGGAVAQINRFMQASFTNLHRPDLDSGLAIDLGRGTFQLYLAILAPLLVALPVVGIVTNLGQSGLLFSGKAITPDLQRINPLAGFQRFFSTRSLVELGKTLLKLTLLTYVVIQTYLDSLPVFLALSVGELAGSVPLLVDTTLHLALTAAVVLLALGILDYAYQRWQFRRDSAMSRDDLREEARQTEGSPQIRQRLRQIQRKLARARMMSEVPRADVVLTNPTHLAVALVYRGEEMAAPLVVAKGAGFVAEKIKKLARANGVPVLENKPLARALFNSVEVGMSIPADLFQAVAEVLAYIYSLRTRRAVNV